MKAWKSSELVSFSEVFHADLTVCAMVCIASCGGCVCPAFKSSRWQRLDCRITSCHSLSGLVLPNHRQDGVQRQSGGFAIGSTYCDKRTSSSRGLIISINWL